MNIIDIINKKRLKGILTNDEIKYIVNDYVNGNIKDYQMSSLLMAICINGMNFDETYYLTDAMLNSGDILDLSKLNKNIVDKHSTGGVGDKVTLIVAPIVSSCGVGVLKMSGKGLGHTGGTIDKLESISGFNTKLSLKEAIDQVNDIGLSIISQQETIVPADKLMYALRDVTGTVESIPLIASSVMSKKLATSAPKIVIELTVGEGALIKNTEDARLLSKLMIDIGKKYDREVVCVLTRMDSPLGYTIGNALEIKESIDFLNGTLVSEDLKEIVIKISSIMVSLGKNISLASAKKEVLENLENKSALKKFEEMVYSQGGNIDDINISDEVISIKSNKMGIVNKINALKLGELAKEIGAGRINKDDIIDYTVGFKLNKKVGDFVLENEELIKVYLSNKNVNINDILTCFTIEDTFNEEKESIIDVVK